MRFMKLLGQLAYLLLFFIFAYLSTAFCEMNFDVREWEFSSRVMCMIFYFVYLYLSSK